MQISKKFLINLLQDTKKDFKEFEGITLVTSNKRIGRKIALCYTANDNYLLKTEFMFYGEMKQYLRGYLAYKEGFFTELSF